MSDDDYAGGGYSPYSDLEDILYDDEPGPDLADDLAAHAMNSPVFYDEPGYELVEYMSDWDYYSDDYYDDDPAILKNNPQDGSPIVRKAEKRKDTQQRGKKRKLVEVEDIPSIDLDERRTLKDCMKGTVWAKPIPERENTFLPGDDDKVALLRDWKSRFGTTSVQDKGTVRRPHLPEDESWANDLSLADMGLRNERGTVAEQSGEKNATQMEEDDDEAGGDGAGSDGEGEAGREAENGIEIDADTAAALLQQMEGMDEEETAALFETLRGQIEAKMPAESADGTPPKASRPLAEAAGSSSPSMDKVSEPLPVLSKRRKQSHNLLPSPPQSNQSPVLDSSDAAAPLAIIDDGAELHRDEKRSRGRQSNHAKTSTNSHTTPASTVGATKTQKRKASTSPSPERIKGVSGYLTGRRTKRMASNVKGVSAETSEREASVTNVSARSTRSRKKL